jgi:hypothetical protein
LDSPDTQPNSIKVTRPGRRSCHGDGRLRCASYGLSGASCRHVPSRHQAKQILRRRPRGMDQDTRGEDQSDQQSDRPRDIVRSTFYPDFNGAFCFTPFHPASLDLVDREGCTADRGGCDAQPSGIPALANASSQRGSITGKLSAWQATVKYGCARRMLSTESEMPRGRPNFLQAPCASKASRPPTDRLYILTRWSRRRSAAVMSDGHIPAVRHQRMRRGWNRRSPHRREARQQAY